MSANNLSSARQLVENKKYIELTMKDYDMTYNAINQRKFMYKLSFKELYDGLVEDEETVIKLQEKLADKDHNEIAHLFTGKTPNIKAYQFLRALYLLDTSRPINNQIIKTCRRLLGEIA